MMAGTRWKTRLFYEDEVYFVLKSTLTEKLIRTTHDKPTGVTHPRLKNYTTMRIKQSANKFRGNEEEQNVVACPSKKLKGRRACRTGYKGHFKGHRKR